MGFWGSLIDGVKSAGGWVLDHSGDIANAVGTVAKIAGPFILVAENDDETVKLAAHKKHLDDFYQNFSVASDLLEKAAKKASKQATEKAAATRNLSASDFAASNAVKDNFCGIWKNPSALLPDGTPAVPMYQDLSKWIGALGVPSSQSIDVAQAIGEALFPIDTVAVQANDAKIKTIPFPYTDPHGKWTLDLGHAYYPLPLGASPSEHCWHSCIYGKFHPSNAHKAEMEAKDAPSTTIFLEELKATDKPIWVVNASINWGNASLASDVHSKLIDTLKNDYKKQGRSVISSKLTGVMQSLQVRGGVTDNPSLLRQGLITTASKIASENTAGQPAQDDSDSSDADSSDDSSADEKTVQNGGLKNGVNKSNKAKRGVGAARIKSNPSAMPLTVPEVDITKSQLVFK